MTFSTATQPYFWYRYSKKIWRRLRNLPSAGTFSVEEAQERKVRFVFGESGMLEHGAWIKVSFLVDTADGTVRDARYQAFGPSALFAAGEGLCCAVLGKSVLYTRSMVADTIDHTLRDKQHLPAFPYESYSYLNMAMEAAEEAACQCDDLDLVYVDAAPEDNSALFEGTPLENWETLTVEQRLSAIQHVLDQDIRPFIALDGGDITIEAFDGTTLAIRYQGACTSCHASTGSTLTSIQGMLRAKVHATIVVKPLL